MKILGAGNLPRRNFLIRCWQRASAALWIPRLQGAQNARSGTGEFHLKPRYRSKASLDDLLLKTKSGLDDFFTEPYNDEIAAILAQWSTSLLDSSVNVQPIAKCLAPGFLGSSPQPNQIRLLRTGPALDVRQVLFAAEPALSGDAFLAGLRAELNAFAKILVAEFQITSVHVDAITHQVRTRVQYELVGTGAHFHREQRAGYWDLEWQSNPTRGYHLRRWKLGDETRSRASQPWYSDISAHVLGGNASYFKQLVPGVDHWRTVLDGACGIDIYGHNGVAVGDIDNDGFDDLYICQPAGLPNRLYRNRGDGTFEDVTEVSGTGILENTACALFADFDNDGRQDLVVVRANGPLLFLNEGPGKFRRKPDAFQFQNAPQGTFTGAAIADYDRDGWLDIYFCLYVYYQGADQYKYPLPYYAAENGPPNFMLRNNRDGTFRDVTAETGLDRNNTRYSFCCGWSDYNQDGWPDLYVVNDFGRKNLYRNNGDGTFTDVAGSSGVEDVGAGMSVCWFDYDNDGAQDLYVADMWTAAGERVSADANFQKESPTQVRALYQKHAMGNSLFRNHGGGVLEDVTTASHSGNGRWSWSSDAWDFDHDGFPDLYIANGMISGPVREDLNSFFWRQVVAKSPDSAKQSQDYEQGWNAVNELIRTDYTWSGYERNIFYANNRDGTFSDVSGAVGLDFIEDGRAFALADFDHDGRQEIFLKNRNGPQLRVLKNVVADLPPSVAFVLRGTRSHRDAIGAVITLETEAGRQSRSLQAGSGFLSQHSKEVFFGLGAVKGPVRASIRWPSGLVQQFRDIPVNHRLFVEEGRDGFRVAAFRAFKEPLSRSLAKPAAPNLDTWLLVPMPAPNFSISSKPLLLTLAPPGTEKTFGQSPRGVQLVNLPIGDTEDVAAIYNILYRRLFDRHRDLTLPMSFLIDVNGNIVKIYPRMVDADTVDRDIQDMPQTAAERLPKALPFLGNSSTYEFGRNNLSLGSAFFERGYFDRAEAWFQLALREDPSSAEACYGLGSAYLKQEKLAQARTSFEQALKLNASYPDTLPNAWNNLGLLATREGRTSDAIGFFGEALRLNPNHWIALENLGNAHRQQKNWADALKALERAVEIRPRDAEANYSLAMVFAQTDNASQAYEYFEKALKLRPGYPEALNNLGVLYLRTNRRVDAVKSFEECIRVAPAFDQSYLNLARVYSIEGDRDRARAILQKLLDQHPDHPQARQALDQLR